MSAAVLQPVWSVPRAWAGERCFIICSGESVKAQARQIRQLDGRIIAVKHGVLLRPDADVLFIPGDAVDAELLPKYQGACIVSRSKVGGAAFARYDIKRVARTKDHLHLSELRSPAHVGGYDSGSSAIHLAHLFGSPEIVLLGYDMVGGHFCPHPMQHPPNQHFKRHMAPLKALAADAKAKGIRIVNCSPISKVDAFERQPLEAFL